MTKNNKPIHAYEMLDAIETEKNDEKKAALLKKYGARPPINFILSLNFNENVILDLPEGMPPMDVKDMDAHKHPDFMGLLASSIARLRHCTISNTTLKKFKKEQIFYEVLINCPLKDAEILCSAKDKALLELYPTITAKFVQTVFPAYVKSVK